MAQPLQFINRDNPNHMCKLCKASYGLKPALCVWYHELRQFLITYGFTNSHVDISLFVLNIGGIRVYLFVYVNSIIIIGAMMVLCKSSF